MLEYDNVLLMPIKPKSVAGQIGHHHYTLQYNPLAADEKERWRWHVRYMRCYDYYGSAETEKKAQTAAQKKIRDEMSYQQNRGV